MSDSETRQVNAESQRRRMPLPTNDDVPMAQDWQPPDTKEELLAYLPEIHDARERARVS